MLKGGYYILDLKDNNLTSSKIVIKGIYNDIDKNHRKVFLLSGIKMNGNLRPDQFGTAVKVSGKYQITLHETVTSSVLSKVTLLVESDDKCSLLTQTIQGSTVPDGKQVFLVRESEG